MNESLIRVLTVTTLYPSVSRPRHGIFVETRLRHIVQSGGIEARVVAPVPWFPFRGERFGRYAEFARIRGEELREGIQVHYPRYVTIPGIAMLAAPMAIAGAVMRTIGRLRRDSFDFDLIDAHYFYPDGVAAAMVARRLGKPLQITARGTDINLLPQYALPRRMIQWSIRQADVVASVSAALERKLLVLGADPARVHVLRNGVDCELFRPMPRTDARRALGITGTPVLASVGNLVPEKGHDLAIEAMSTIPGATLLIVGEGPERRKLLEKARAHGVAERVHILSVRPQSELRVLYSAADVLVLASSREGWPNVLLEAMACGTPVVAAAVGGVDEIVGASHAGIVVTDRSSASFAEAVRRLLADPPTRDSARSHALRFGWSETANRQKEIFRELLRRREMQPERWLKEAS